MKENYLIILQKKATVRVFIFHAWKKKSDYILIIIVSDMQTPKSTCQYFNIYFVCRTWQNHIISPILNERIIKSQMKTYDFSLHFISLFSFLHYLFLLLFICNTSINGNKINFDALAINIHMHTHTLTFG